MKKILCLAMGIMLLSAPAFAKEITTGTIELNGAATLGYQSTDLEIKDGPTTDQTMWGLNLSSEYYFMPNLGVGLLFDYNKTEVDDFETSALGIGPIVSYNVSMNEQVSLPIFAAITYNTQTIGEGDDSDIDGWGWIIGTGVKYFMNDYVSLNGIVDYGQIYWETDTNKIEIDQAGFSVYGGLSVYFPGM